MRLTRRELEGRAGAFAFARIERWLSKKDLLQSERIGEKLGRLAFRFEKRRRRIALENVGRAFPHLPEEERLRIVQGVFEHFGCVTCDFVRTTNRSKEEVLDSMEPEGHEHIEAARAKGKGLIVVTAHFGNWERMAQYMTLTGDRPFSVIVRDANNPDLNEIVLKMREAAGLGIISRGNAARAVLTKLKNNEIVGILPDQNASDVFLPFFGKPCGIVLGPAVLGARAGAPLVPIWCPRVGPGKYRFIIDPPLEPEPGCEHAEGMMRSYNRALERIITQYPEQYLWLHDRWKSAKQEGLI